MDVAKLAGWGTCWGNTYWMENGRQGKSTCPCSEAHRLTMEMDLFLINRVNCSLLFHDAAGGASRDCVIPRNFVTAIKNR